MFSDADFHFVQQGSVVSVWPLTEGAQNWVDENVHTEEWQWLGDSFVCEPRLARDLLAGVIESGMSYTINTTTPIHNGRN